jgi:sodium/pantothenate symporter
MSMMDYFQPSNSWAILAAHSATSGAVGVFVIYIVAVLVIAWLSNKMIRSKDFLNEYFLGSRSLGLWAFALTFAATSSSGGSFIGFPSMVYSHGWVVALWIGGYMIVPIVAMALLGKRLNQIARLRGSITMPDVLRDRFNSPLLGTVATLLIVFFMIFNLVAQFKGGSVILQSLLQDEPLFEQLSQWFGHAISGMPFLGEATGKPGYLLSLLVFALVVIVYTAYGGFRAVVWTDVMQGLVMLSGVLILLPLTIWSVGGLDRANREIARMTPPNHVLLRLTVTQPSTQELLVIPHNSWLVQQVGEDRRVFRTKIRCEVPVGQIVAQFRRSSEIVEDIPAIELTYAAHKESQAEADGLSAILVEVVSSEAYQYGANQPGVYVYGPGPDPKKVDGFLPISLAVSFFFMWTFSTAGQPSNMVRLMAFSNTRTLRRAIFTVSIYYTLIYIPLLLIFCCARVLLPGWETEPDRIMPEMARATSALANMPWLAGLLLAAPFAAVMSTMDSFLLMISSAVVRDVYQQNFNPSATEKTIKRITYATTLIVGLIGMVVAINPPPQLQDIIVFTGTGLSTSFLVAVFLALYWPRFNLPGVFGAILAGFGSHVALYAIGTLQHPKYAMTAYEPFGFHPFVCGTLISLLVAVVVTINTKQPPNQWVRQFFGRPQNQV